MSQMTQNDIAEQIAEKVAPLVGLAQRHELGLIAYLLQMVQVAAIEEADRQAMRRRKRA